MRTDQMKMRIAALLGWTGIVGLGLVATACQPSEMSDVTEAVRNAEAVPSCSAVAPLRLGDVFFVEEQAHARSVIYRGTPGHALPYCDGTDEELGGVLGNAATPTPGSPLDTAASDPMPADPSVSNPAASDPMPAVGGSGSETASDPMPAKMAASAAAIAADGQRHH